MTDTNHAIRQITTTASALGAELPQSLTDGLAFSADIPAEVDYRRQVVEEISAAFGAKDYERKRDAALARLAAVVEANSVDTRRMINAKVADYRWRATLDHSAQILAAFEESTRADFEILNSRALDLPRTFRPEPQAIAGLTPRQFESYSALRTSAERVEKAIGAVRPLLDFAAPNAGLSIAHQNRAAVIVLPEDLDDDTLLAIARGIAGVRRAVVSWGETTFEAVWSSTVAHLGATFAMPRGDEPARVLRRLDEAIKRINHREAARQKAAAASGITFWG